MKYLMVVSCAVMLICQDAFSQNKYTLSGLVIDQAGKKIAVAEAALLRTPDSVALKKTVVTNGSFIMDTTLADDYFIKVTAFGFADKILRVTLDESKTVTVQMEPSTKDRLVYTSFETILFPSKRRTIF